MRSLGSLTVSCKEYVKTQHSGVSKNSFQADGIAMLAECQQLGCPQA
jgi:hypothetical protein